MAALAYRGESLNSFARQLQVTGTAVSYVSRGKSKSYRISKAISDYVEETKIKITD
jgi:hypothetical protein